MIALVTGATAGFGTAITRLLIARGHKVIATGRRAERLQALHAELGDACLPLAFDISDEAATLAALAKLPPAWQEIDLLVNNAGLALGAAPFPDCELADWKQMIATNVGGLVTVTYAVLKGMVARNRGHIINLGSTGRLPVRGRQHLRRDQSLRQTIQPQPARRSAGHQRARLQR